MTKIEKILKEVKRRTNADIHDFSFIELLLLDYIAEDRERLDKLEIENKELRDLIHNTFKFMV